MVFVDLRVLLVPSVLPLIFRSGLVEELDLEDFLNFPWRPLLFLVRAFYFLDIRLGNFNNENYYIALIYKLLVDSHCINL